ncbi:mce associated protein mas1a [Mycolicibacterium sp.]|uniref:mce associated protein mas1a n=1 Tax=Mycolicibacterium sp. TaxID=2320850 RepID=UPI003560890E
MSRDDVTDPEDPEVSTTQTLEPEATEAPEPAPVASRSWLRRAVVPVLLAAVLALGGALGYTLYQQSELHRWQQQAVSTARDYLVAMASFDYQDLDANKGAITADSTPEFAQKYDEMVAALRDIVVTSKGVAAATAEHVAVERLDDESATVIGFVDQQVTNVTAPEGNTQRYRMLVELVRDGDRWIVNDVKTL